MIATRATTPWLKQPTCFFSAHVVLSWSWEQLCNWVEPEDSQQEIMTILAPASLS